MEAQRVQRCKKVQRCDQQSCKIVVALVKSMATFTLFLAKKKFGSSLVSPLAPLLGGEDGGEGRKGPGLLRLVFLMIISSSPLMALLDFLRI